MIFLDRQIGAQQDRPRDQPEHLDRLDD